MVIRLNSQNSKVLGGRVYITQAKVHKLPAGLVQHINTGSSIVHPTLGKMVEYTGPLGSIGTRKRG
jgi:hypothetical protein